MRCSAEECALHQTVTNIYAVEVIGYVGRALNAAEKSGQWTQGPYIIQALLLLLGPPFYAASIYMVLGRLIRLLDAEKYSMVRLKWLTKFFLLGDIASILGQGAGKLWIQAI